MANDTPSRSPPATSRSNRHEDQAPRRSKAADYELPTRPRHPASSDERDRSGRRHRIRPRSLSGDRSYRHQRGYQHRRSRSRSRGDDRGVARRREHVHAGRSRSRDRERSRERRRERPSNVGDRVRNRSREDTRTRRRDGSGERRDRSMSPALRDRSRSRTRRSMDRPRDRSRDRKRVRPPSRSRSRPGERHRRRARSADRKRRRYDSDSDRPPVPRRERDDIRRRGRSRSYSRHRDRQRRRPRSRSDSRSPIRSRQPLPSQVESYNQARSSRSPTPEKLEKQKPNFKPTGLLAREANTVAGTDTVLKYHEPPDARRPPTPWTLVEFKKDDCLGTHHIQKRSTWLFGRDPNVADHLLQHPSISGQHAVIQFRFTGKSAEAKQVKPYLIDLESSNGTFLNDKRIETTRFVELREKDVIKFGGSEREYVVMVARDD